ncbi:MAG: oligosaccharide flippase family protein [Planctomycetota bacterium]
MEQTNLNVRSLKNSFYAVLPQSAKNLANRIDAHPLAGRLARGAFWSLTGAVISRGLTLIAFIITARILGKEGFGELGIIQSTVGMFGVFVGFGMSLTATKYIAEFRLVDPQKAGRIMMLSRAIVWITAVLISLGLLLAAPWLAEHTLKSPRLVGMLRISALLLLLSGVNGAQIGVLTGFEAFKAIAQINFIGGVLSFLLMVGGVYWLGLEGALWALVASQALVCVFSYVALRRESAAIVRAKLFDCFAELSVVWGFSFPAMLSNAIVGPTNWVCSVILINQANGYAEMGIFNAANQWRTNIFFISGALSAAVLPMLSSASGSNDRSTFLKILRLSVLVQSIAVFCLIVPIAALSGWIMSFYGTDFIGGQKTLLLLIMSAIIMAPLNVIGQVIVSLGRMWWGLLLNLIWASTFIGCFVEMREMGAVGLAVASIISYAVHFVTVTLYAWFVVFKRKDND